MGDEAYLNIEIIISLGVKNNQSEKFYKGSPNW
jgi:hypothetical protein